MTRRVFALLSEFPNLNHAQRNLVTDIIPDDGEWSQDQIAAHINAAMARETESPDVEFYR